MWPFSDFQYGFRSFRSTADHLTVASDRNARAFNRATQAVACDISKAFHIVWHAGLFHKLKSYGIPVQIFGLISYFLSNKWLRVVLDGKSSQEYLPDGVISNIAIYADINTLYCKCNQASDLWQ